MFHNPRFRIRRRFSLSDVFFLVTTILLFGNQVSIAQFAEVGEKRSAANGVQSTHRVASAALDTNEQRILEARSLFLASQELRDRVDLCKARDLAERALKIYATADCGGRREFGSALAIVGAMDIELCDYQKAIVELEQAKQILQSTSNLLVPENLLMINCNLGVAYGRLGNMHASKAVLTTVLDQLRNSSLTSSPIYSLALLNICNSYIDNGQPDPAQALLQQAQHLEKTARCNDADFAAALAVTIGRFHLARKEYQAAEDKFRVALAAIEKDGDFPHERFARFSNDFAECLAKQGKHHEAIVVLDQRLGDMEKCLGGKHPRIVEIYCRKAAAQEIIRLAARPTPVKMSQ